MTVGRYKYAKDRLSGSSLMFAENIIPLFLWLEMRRYCIIAIKADDASIMLKRNGALSVTGFHAWCLAIPGER
jgi:hypothetical protein